MLLPDLIKNNISCINVIILLQVIATVLTLIGDKRKSRESIACLKLPLSKFMGVSRRFDLIGTIYGCHIYDDYAHHPTEVRAVLQAARQRFPNKALLVVFQPHTYRCSPQNFFAAVSFLFILLYCLQLNLDNFLSRLVALKDDFATALSEADQVVVSAVLVFLLIIVAVSTFQPIMAINSVICIISY